MFKTIGIWIAILRGKEVVLRVYNRYSLRTNRGEVMTKTVHGYRRGDIVREHHSASYDYTWNTDSEGNRNLKRN